MSMFDNVDATKKWVEYALKHHYIRQRMSGRSFVERCGDEAELARLDKKLEYMYRHKNFNLNQATSQYKNKKRFG